MRIAAKPVRHYPWYLKPFFWNQKRRYGQVLDPALLWGRVPRLFAAVATLYGALDSSRRLGPVLRSLVTVRVSQINSCTFCVDINSATLAGRCGSFDKVHELSSWRSSEMFAPAERAALAYTDAMTIGSDGVSEEVFAELREHFDDDTIIELTALVAFQNMSTKFNNALAVPAQGFCAVPESGGERKQTPVAAVLDSPKS